MSLSHFSLWLNTKIRVMYFMQKCDRNLVSLKNDIKEVLAKLTRADTHEGRHAGLPLQNLTSFRIVGANLRVRPPFHP
jgi:hypothetical protein